MPPAGERITVAELGRRFDRFEQEWREDFALLGRKIDALTFVDRETLDTKLMLEAAHRAELERRIAHLEAESDRRDEVAATNRRLAVTGLVFPFLVAVAVALILASIGLR